MRAVLFGLVVAIGFAPQLSGQALPQDQAPAQVQAPAGPKLQLTFEEGGKVSLVANGATLREILAEWSRKGGTPFVGAERLSGGPLTLQYDHRPETEVVGSLLRSASGVIMAPRREGSVGVSQIEVVFVLATSNASAAVSSYSAPTYSAPPPPQFSSQGSPDQEVAPIGGPGRAGQPPAQQAPPPAATPAPRPAGMSGIAVPLVGVPTATTTAPPPTPPTTGTGRGGGGGGGGR